MGLRRRPHFDKPIGRSFRLALVQDLSSLYSFLVYEKFSKPVDCS